MCWKRLSMLLRVRERVGCNMHKLLPVQRAFSVAIVRDHYYSISPLEFNIIYNGFEKGAVKLPPATGTGDVYTVKNVGAFEVTLDAGISAKIDDHQSHKLSHASSISLIDYDHERWGII